MCLFIRQIKKENPGRKVGYSNRDKKPNNLNITRNNRSDLLWFDHHRITSTIHRVFSSVSRPRPVAVRKPPPLDVVLSFNRKISITKSLNRTRRTRIWWRIKNKSNQVYNILLTAIGVCPFIYLFIFSSLIRCIYSRNAFYFIFTVNFRFIFVSSCCYHELNSF